MSRVGKLPINLPEKVSVSVEKSLVRVEGPKGKLEKRFNAPVAIKVDGVEVTVNQLDKSRFAQAMQGTARSIIANMIHGVTEGFTKNVEIKGVGFRASIEGNKLNLNVGYSHPIDYTIPEGINISITDNTKLKVDGTDKQLVGEVCAKLKRFYPPEPYKGKGIHIEGEYVRRKEGKTVA